MAVERDESVSERLQRNQLVIDEFRSAGGVVGGPFEGMPLLLLTTTGARSGQPRTTPMVYFKDGTRGDPSRSSRSLGWTATERPPRIR